MTTKDVLELALEALETCTYTSSYEKHFDIAKVEEAIEAITAIKQAQQAQEPVAWVWNPAKESWEQVRAYGHWQQGAIYAFGPKPPAPKQAQQAQEPVETEYFGLEPWERDKPTSPTADMNIAQRILHVGGRNNEAGYVEFGSIQAVEALVRQVLRDLPAPKQAEPTQSQKTWCEYVAGIIGTYLNEPFESEKCKAISGIIERRLWALPKPPEAQ